MRAQEPKNTYFVHVLSLSEVKPKGREKEDFDLIKLTRTFSQPTVRQRLLKTQNNQISHVGEIS